LVERGCEEAGLVGGIGGDRKTLEPGAGELVEVLERDRGLARPFVIDGAALVVEHLLHPETGGRAIEKTQQR
jgi:hypothetical protein